MKRKNLALTLAALMAVSMLGGCGSSSDSSQTEASAEETTQADVAEQTESTEQTAQETEATEGNTEFSGTLKLYGPGLFASVGLDGTVDMITGVKKPGYQVVIDRWKELYPNVELDIEPIPWDNWKASLQTAAISGDVDILVHGGSLGPVVEPLQPYLDKDPDYLDKVTMTTDRRNADLAPLNEVIPAAVTIQLNPVMAIINKTIFEDYGVEVPDYKTWTLDDLMEAAKATTGTDPKTGKQTYGISPIKLSDANKNYIWASRCKNNEIFEWGDSIKDSKMNFVGEGTAEVMNYLTEFKAYTSPDYIEGLDLANAWTEDHDIAIVIVENPFDVYNTLKANGVEDQYTLAALPQIEDGPYKGVTSTHFGDWHMSICKNSENKDLAWEFLKFMTIDPVVQKWLLDCYAIPNNIEANENLEQYMSPEFAECIRYVIDTCPAHFSCSENECYDSGNFGTFMNDVATALNEMYQGNMDVNQAMEFVQKNVDDFLSTLN